MGKFPDARRDERLVIDDKFIGDNPRDIVVVRLKSLKEGLMADKLITRRLEEEREEKAEKLKELQRLEDYKFAYVAIFDKLCGKYLGFTASNILTGGGDVKTIEALEEIIVARAKNNLRIGLGIAIITPVLGWMILAWSLLESPSNPYNYSNNYSVLNIPLMFLLLRKKLQKRGIDASSLIKEKYRYTVLVSEGISVIR